MGLNTTNKKGEEYKKYSSDVRKRTTLQGWNRLSDFQLCNYTSYRYDVEDISKDLWVYANRAESIGKSKYAIGFEIEKTHILSKCGQLVGQYDVGSPLELHNNELIKGTETDSSCGVEMVTNALPLVPKSRWRNKIVNAFYDVSNVLDSPTTSNCGGHIHVSVHDVDSNTLKKWLRITTPLLMSLYKKRLQNYYCGSDLLMMDNLVPLNAQSWRGLHTKFNMVTLHTNTVEFRIPSAVTSTQQLINRYDLMFLVVDYAVKMKGEFDTGLFNEFLRKARPIIKKMYAQSPTKVTECMKYARRFSKFMESDGRLCHSSLRDFVGTRTDGYIGGSGIRSNSYRYDD